MSSPVISTPNELVEVLTTTFVAVNHIPTFRGASAKSVGDALKVLASHDSRGFTPLHHAVSANNKEMTQNLISIFRLVRSPLPILDAVDLEGRTPLHWAIQRASDVVISLLIEAGANVNATDSNGRSCLHYTLLSSVEGDKGDPSYYQDLTRYLLERGADVNQVDSFGATAVHLASELGRDGILSILVELGGATVNTLDFEGENPLFYAARENQMAIMAKLIDYGIDWTQPNASMETVVEFCQSINENKLAQYLLDLSRKTEEDKRVYQNGDLLESSSSILRMSEDFPASMWSTSMGPR